MARLIPTLTEEQLLEIPSQGESRFYRACRNQLDDFWTILYSVSWISRIPYKHAIDGETDFLILSPNSGMLVVEIKGGGISLNARSNSWVSINRYGIENPIKNPFFQSKKAMHNILLKLLDRDDWRKNVHDRILIGYSAFFPDISNKTLISAPDRPSQIIGIKQDLDNLKQWITAALKWWKNKDPSLKPMNSIAAKIVNSTFAKSFRVKPLIVDRIKDEEKARINLTMQQARLLRTLGSHRRVAITGGAGTGKTVLALEKAQSLSKDGLITLLTCYNRPLADHLKSCCRNFKRIKVCNFHQLCWEILSRVKASHGMDFLGDAERAYLDSDKYDFVMPYALALALEVTNERFDAVVVDEGQDFRSEYWLPIEMILADLENSPLYIFYDNNQSLYNVSADFPIKSNDTFELTINCRNTRAIYNVAYNFYEGSHIDPPTIAGVDVFIHGINGTSKQAEFISKKILKLLKNDGLEPENIAVLIVDNSLKVSCQKILLNYSLPDDISWIEDSISKEGSVRIDSVHRFKGLEADIVILWGFDSLNISKNREVFYVALSRPKSELHLVGNKQRIQEILHQEIQ